MNSYRFPLSLAVFGGCLLVNGIASSAPATLEFDAVVGPPRAGFGDNIGLPFSWAEGAIISGQFTFDPVDVQASVTRTEAVQPYAIQFTVNGFTFGTSHYLIDVQDDGLTFPDIGPPFELDEIRIGCSLRGASDVCGERLVDGPGSDRFGFAINLGGEANVLEGADIPADAAVWSSFNDFGSSIRISFFDSATSGSEGLIASIVRFRLVPEPSSSLLVLSSLIILSYPHRR